MNLREEIFLSSNRFTKSYHKTHELTNEILSIFEKRIDERLGQLSFFEENLNNDEYKFNVKKHDREIAKTAIQNKRLAFLEMKDMLSK